MIFGAILVLVSVLNLAASLPVNTRAACNDYLIISTRGTGEPQGPSIGFVTMIPDTLEAIPNGATHDTVYPASLDQNSASGTADILNTMKTTLTSCPNTKFALLGYSQGAAATVDALDEIQPDDSTGSAVAAVFLIGNPQRLPNKQADVDQNGGNTQANANGISSRLPGAGIPDVWDESGRVLDVCFTGDGVCSGFAITPQHLLYGTTQATQDLGIKFLTSKLQGKADMSPFVE